jgi:hypothetical protein
LVAMAPDNDAGKIAGALIAAERSDPAAALVSRAAAADLAVAIETLVPDTPTARGWLRALALNPDKSAAVLASGRLRHASTLLALAKAMDPDGVPNDAGEDPWWIAARTAKGKLSGSDEDYFAGFLMARGLGRISRSPADLFRRSYTTVHKALSRGRLPFEVERHVVGRLTWGSWLDWDRVSRLRATVVARFVDDRLDPETFGRLSDDGPIIRALIDEAARSGRGRRYLDEVRSKLRHADEKGIRSRAEYIAEKLR